MKNSLISTTAAIALLLASSNGIADEPHVTDQVKATAGTWAGQLTSTSQGAYFTDIDGNNKGDTYTFSVDPSTPLTYGFNYTEDSDFNVSYTLALYQNTNNNKGLQFSSPACVFVITAESPATPDVRAESYEGADCSFTTSYDGDVYTVSPQASK